MSQAPSVRGEPVFVVVHRRIKAGHEATFEAAMCEFMRIAVTQPG